MSRKRQRNRNANVPRFANPSRVAVDRDPFAHASLVVAGLLLAAVFLIFGQTIGHGFLIFDDQTYVQENPQLTEGTLTERIVCAFTTNRAANWHPLTWLSHLLDAEFYGVQKQNAGGHHCTNVLLHAASAMLLFLALRRMTGDFWPSALAAALFAVHPLRVESVAWVAERKDVLSGLFFMLTLWAYAGYVSHPFSLARYLAIAASLALGLMAKPTLVTLPLVLLLLDYWPLRRLQRGPLSGGADIPVCPMSVISGGRQECLPHRSGKCEPTKPAGTAPAVGRLIVEKIPLFLLAAGSCVVTYLVQRVGIDAFVSVAWPWRIGNAAVSYVAYLMQFFCPVNLAVIYPHPGQDVAIGKIAAAVAVLLAITAGVVILHRRSPYLLTGWLWYLGMLVPMIGLVQVGWQARADRYTYLPQIGLCIMVAWGIRQAAVSRVARRWALVGALAALAVLTGLAYRQTTFWRDDRTLWEHALDCTEDNFAAHLHLGTALNANGAFPAAVAQYQAAERLAHAKPWKCSARDAAAIATNLGSLFLKTGHLDDALAHYRQALKIDPMTADNHVNLAAVLKEQGRLDEAISQCKTALEIDPHNARAYNNLGAALEAQGRLVAAMSYYEKAVELRTDYADARRNLAAIVRPAHETPAAVVRWRDWIDLRPRDYVMIDNAAWFLATSDDASLRNGADAIKLARRAIELVGPREPTTLSTLAAAYAEAGRFAEAVETAQQAVTLARQQGKFDLVKSIEEKLPLYKSHKPYHQPPPAPH